MIRNLKMPRYTAYLCGPIQDAVDGGVKWREQIAPKLSEIGIEVLDPTKIEAEEYGSIEKAHIELQNYVACGNWDEWDKRLDGILKRDIEAVYKSNFIIAFYDVNMKMGGTLCEIWEAVYHRKIPIYVVSRNAKRDWNMWMLRTVRKTGQVFDSWAQLTEFLTEKYGKKNDARIYERMATCITTLWSRTVGRFHKYMARQSSNRREDLTNWTKRLSLRLTRLYRVGSYRHESR